MKVFDILVSLLLMFAIFPMRSDAQKTSELQLYYNKPATHWNEALPLGNGYMGGMVFGGIDQERLQLNEATLYSGENTTRKQLNINIRPLFDTVLNAIKYGDYDKANSIVKDNWQGSLVSSYQPLGDLFIGFNYSGKKSNYKRVLDIEKAILTTSYDIDGVTYSREIFASYPDRVFVIRIRNSSNAPFYINLSYTSQHPGALVHFSTNGIVLRGQAPGYVERRTIQYLENNNLRDRHPFLFAMDGSRKTNKQILYGADIDNMGMYFQSEVKVLKGTSKEVDGKLKVSGTGEIILIFTSVTSFNGYDKSPSGEGIEYKKLASEIIYSAEKKGYNKLLERHLTDYRKIFNRTSLKIAASKDRTSIPTDERIDRFKGDPDNQLVNLLFQYGRYLLIASSRKGGQAANLQGIWNNDRIPFCNSDYTININTEMNYWHAETTGLEECLPPFFQLIKELSVTGHQMASKMYGLPGWAAHHNTSLWREAYPTDGDPKWFFWNLGGAWLCSHLWEHYLFTGDKEFLKNIAYPLMKGAAVFFNGWLIKDNKGHWITPIGTSPENTFYSPKGNPVAVSSSPTMDNAIIYELFKNTIEAAKILGIDQSLSGTLAEKKIKLPPYKIGARGQLQEWQHDLTETELYHRHLSHLYALYPGNDLSLNKTPELIPAIKKTLEIRGDDAPGWALAWRVCFWARLMDGNHAYDVIKNVFTLVPVQYNNTKGGLLPNLFGVHPPFQLDGNFGFTAGVVEMLLQSHDGEINILPALPGIWNTGEVKGLRARGGFIVDISWENEKVKKVKIQSILGNQCRLRTKDGIRDFKTEPGKAYRFSF